MSRRDRATSERVDVHAYQRSPGDYLIACMHVATYEWARPHVEGRDVLDFGCGTGYGADLLAPSAATVHAVDVSQDAVSHASATWAHDNLTFSRVAPVEQASLPFDDDSFDTVLSFQVIEHLPDVDAYLREARRVLRPGGVFVCATPDRTTRLDAGQQPWNVFHLVEFSEVETVAMLQRQFDEVETFGMTTDPLPLADLEFDRYDKLRRFTKPFTFATAPEWWRRGGLRALKALRPDPGGEPRPATSFGFGTENIVVAPDVHRSLNVLAVAR